MATQIPLPTGSYALRDPRASTKRLVNLLSEISPQTSTADTKQSQPPITLKRMPGTVQFALDPLGLGPLGPVRGFHRMNKVVYAVIGPNLYHLTVNGILTQIPGASVPGTGFVRMIDNNAVMIILVPATSAAFIYSPTLGFLPFIDPTFLALGAIDVWYIDSFFVFLALNGREFYNDDGQAVSGQGVPTFTSGGVFPNEFSTDPFVGMVVDHREVILFGELTTQGYVNVGAGPIGSPFAAAPDAFMQIGMDPSAAYSAALQDQSVFWVANDRTVRRRNGQTPSRVSNSGIEQILQKANLKGCYALTPSIDGHPLWILTMPAEFRTICYDCLTTEWCELESFGIGIWRPLSWYNVFGAMLIGDSQSGTIGILDSTVFTDFNAVQPTYFITQSVYDAHNRIIHRRLELIITAGGQSNLLLNPMVSLHISDDGGRTFEAVEERSLGQTGEYESRAVWFNLGQSYDRVYKFAISDAAPTYTVDVQATLDGGKW